MFRSTKALKISTYVVRVALLLVCAYYLIVWMGWNYVFSVNHINIVGINGKPLEHMNVDDAALASVLKGNFFNVDLRKVTAVMLQMSWVEQVRVQRIFPNTLQVRVKEYQLLGRWDKDFVSQSGVIFRLPLAQRENIPQNLPLFAGDDDYLPQAVAFYRHWQPLFKRVGWNIRQVLVSKRQAWKLKIKSKNKRAVEVVLGRNQYKPGMNERLSKLLVAFPDLERRFPSVSYIDLRYATGVALRLGK